MDICKYMHEYGCNESNGSNGNISLLQLYIINGQRRTVEGYAKRLYHIINYLLQQKLLRMLKFMYFSANVTPQILLILK